MSDQDGARPDDVSTQGPGITEAPESAWSLTPPASETHDTTILPPGPTMVSDAETARIGGGPTTVDPTAAPYVAPSWSSPAPPLPSSSIPPPPPSGIPQYGATQYGAPQYGAGLPGVAGWGAVPLAPKPGVIPLRPLTVGEILDGAVSYIRRDPKTVLGISACFALVIAVLQFVALAVASGSFLSTGGATSSPFDGLAADLASATASIVQYAVTWVIGVIATGLLTVVMGQAVLGRRVTLSQTWGRTSSRLLPLFGLTLLIAVAVGGLSTIGIGIAVLLGWALSNVDIALGIVVGVVVGIAVLLLALWANIRLLLAPVALILEGAGVITSMRRSWALVAGAWWRTFGIYLLGSILAAIVSSVIAIPFALVGTVLSVVSLSGGDSSTPIGYYLGLSLATLVSTLVVIPFTSGVVALLYIDRRIRREALDIELSRAAGIRA